MTLTHLAIVNQIEIETEASNLSNGDISKLKQVQLGLNSRTSHMAQNETSRAIRLGEATPEIAPSSPHLNLKAIIPIEDF